MSHPLPFRGSFTALVTPFRDGAVDEKAFRDLVDWQIEEGIHGLVPVGTTGESPTVSHDEHKSVVEWTVAQAAGRVPVIAGAGSNSTVEAIEYTRFAKEAGADAVLHVTGYYNKPSQEGMYRHFMTVADAVDIPIILYNIPGRTGRNVEPETIARLAELEPIVAIKEAAGSLDQVSDILVRTNLTVLSGDDSLTLPMLAVGAEGVVSVAANLVPKDVISLIDDFNSGEIGSARKRHARLFPLCRDLLGLAPNPVPLKAAMALLKRGNGELRLPLCPLDESETARLSAALAQYGLLSR